MTTTGAPSVETLTDAIAPTEHVFPQAARIIAKFGGEQHLARVLRVNPSTVYRWTYPTSRGGSDGLIPDRAKIKIMRHARRDGILLRPEDWSIT